VIQNHILFTPLPEEKLLPRPSRSWLIRHGYLWGIRETECICVCMSKNMNSKTIILF
jgi:hypothetical protein